MSETGDKLSSATPTWIDRVIDLAKKTKSRKLMAVGSVFFGCIAAIPVLSKSLDGYLKIIWVSAFLALALLAGIFALTIALSLKDSVDELAGNEGD